MLARLGVGRSELARGRRRLHHRVERLLELGAVAPGNFLREPRAARLCVVVELICH